MTGILNSTVFADIFGDTSISSSGLNHKKLNSGKLIIGGHRFEAIADGTNADVYFSRTLPSGISAIHFSVGVAASGYCRTNFYRNPTVSADGIAIAAYNKYRKTGASDIAQSGVFHSPTVTNAGTLMVPGIIPAGRGIVAIGGVGDMTEWITNGDESLLLRITNLSGSASDVVVTLEAHL